MHATFYLTLFRLQFKIHCICISVSKLIQSLFFDKQPSPPLGAFPVPRSGVGMSAGAEVASDSIVVSGSNPMSRSHIGLQNCETPYHFGLKSPSDSCILRKAL
jgi:hypothetical protein